jgi:iron complex outermembrane receptor protein
LGVASVIATLVASIATGSAWAEDDIDLASFDLEDLMSMEVTSVSKKAERAFEAPAAAFVITSEDIRRSGMRSLPELLRLAPGAQVAQLNSSFWSISVRGFSSSFSDKLLVLIDGRSVYTPLFAGVFWAVQDLPLADVDRIEVIRGPGGTVWGANAVNGVINIVTKSSADTQGWHAELVAGEYERAGSGVMRYGGKVNDNVTYRFYVKHFEREAFDKADDVNDEWRRVRTGFRMDAEVSENGHLTLQGDLYDGKSNGVIAEAPSVSELGGGNVLARYTHTLSEEQSVTAQFYYDRTDRALNILRYELDTFDVELRHQIKPVDWLEVVWGGEYRHRNDDSRSSNPATPAAAGLQGAFDIINIVHGAGSIPDPGKVLHIDPADRKMDLYSGFVQLEGRAFDEQVRLTVGSKFEDNDFSGFEWQPSARLAYVPSETLTVWGSFSRAVRTPSRANHDITTVGETELTPGAATDANLTLTRSEDFDSEELLAYEMGLRIQPHEAVHVDIAGFYNDYDELQAPSFDQTYSVAANTLGAGVPPNDINVLVLDGGNHAKGEAWGIELFTRVELPVELPAVRKWMVDATYSYIDVDIERKNGDPIDETYSSDSALEDSKTEAHHTVGLRSRMSLDCDLEFDINWFYVSRVKDVGPGDNDVEGYHRVDLRGAWLPNDNVELSVVAQNVFESVHREWNTELFVPATKIPRTVYGKLALKF